MKPPAPYLSESQNNHSQTIVACTPATMDTLTATLASTAGAFFFMEARFLTNATSSEIIDLLNETVSETWKLTLMSEIKLCVRTVSDLNIPIFTHTGGVLLIAGVGSYCAYQLSRFFLSGWTLLESSRYDLLARADSRLLHTVSEGFYDVRVGEGNLYQMKRFIDTVKTKTHSKISLLASASDERCGTALIRKMAEKIKSRKRDDSGLAEICEDHTANLPPRESDTTFGSLQLHAGTNSSTLKEKNSPNICGRILNASKSCLDKSRPRCFGHDIERERREVKQKCVAHQTRSASTNAVERYKFLENTFDIEKCDKHSDTASISFQLIWQDEPSWDNEFADDFNQDDYTSPTPSGISNLSVVKNIEALFENHERRDAAALNRISILSKKQCKKQTPSLHIKSCSSLRRYCSCEDDKTSLVSMKQTNYRESIPRDETVSVLSSRYDKDILTKCLNANIDYMYRSTIDYRNHFELSDKESCCENNPQSYQRCSNFQLDNEDSVSNALSMKGFIARSNTPVKRQYFSEGLWELTSTTSYNSSSSMSRDMVEKLDGELKNEASNCESILSRFDITKSSTINRQVKPVRIGELVRNGNINKYTNDDTYHGIKCNQPDENSTMFDSAIALTESISSAAGCTLTSKNETD